MSEDEESMREVPVVITYSPVKLLNSAYNQNPDINSYFGTVATATNSIPVYSTELYPNTHKDIFGTFVCANKPFLLQRTSADNFILDVLVY